MQESQEMWGWSLGQEDLLEEGMATHSSFLAWSILWTVGPGGLQSIRWQTVGHDLATEHSAHGQSHHLYFNKAKYVSYDILRFHALHYIYKIYWNCLYFVFSAKCSAPWLPVLYIYKIHIYIYINIYIYKKYIYIYSFIISILKIQSSYFREYLSILNFLKSDILSSYDDWRIVDTWALLVAQTVKKLPAMQETWVWSPLDTQNWKWSMSFSRISSLYTWGPFYQTFHEVLELISKRQDENETHLFHESSINVMQQVYHVGSTH